MVINWYRRLLPRQSQARLRACKPVGARAYHLRLEALGERLLLSTFTVTNRNDAGMGSLRQAILDANAHEGLNTIAFDIGGGGVQTIQPTSALPAITNPVILDGTTQPGFAGRPLIELDGSKEGLVDGLLQIRASASTVRGLVINRVSGSAIDIAGAGATANQVQGNYIGTDVTGTVALGNGAVGVEIQAPGNTIGGMSGGGRNLISGNGGFGIDLRFAADDTVIQDNYIGTDVTGTVALGNETGVYIEEGDRTTIGGTEPGAGNLISGNQFDGIDLFTDGNLVQGNFIGTDVTGTAPLGNGESGINGSGSNNTIGGTVAGAGNLISGNRFGVLYQGPLDTVIQGNYFGTDVTGTVALGNREDGLVISGATVGGTMAGAGNLISGNLGNGVYLTFGGGILQGNDIGTDVTGTAPLGNGENGVLIDTFSTTIGGTAAGAANRIAFNGSNGVEVNRGGRNAIRRNVIFGHENGLGIELVNGGNHDQEFPTLTYAVFDGATTTVTGTLSSAANTAYTIEIFVNAVCNPTGYGEGEHFLASFPVTTDADGNTAFTLSVAIAVDPGQFITATATDPANNTSQFAACVEVTASDSPSRGVARPSGHFGPGPVRGIPFGPAIASVAMPPGSTVVMESARASEAEAGGATSSVVPKPVDIPVDNGDETFGDPMSFALAADSTGASAVGAIDSDGSTINGNGALALIYSDSADNIRSFDPNSIVVPITP